MKSLYKHWMAELELLDKINVLGDVLGSFNPEILLHSIKLVLKMIAKMKASGQLLNE